MSTGTDEIDVQSKSVFDRLMNKDDSRSDPVSLESDPTSRSEARMDAGKKEKFEDSKGSHPMENTWKQTLLCVVVIILILLVL